MPMQFVSQMGTPNQPYFYEQLVERKETGEK